MTSLRAFELPVEESQHRTPVWRRVTGGLLLVVAAGLAGLFGYGTVNPRRYVVLLEYFNNPAEGALLVLALATVAYVLAFPIRSTVIDRRRSILRTTMLILTAISLIVFLFAYELAIFRYQSDTLATSPQGDRSVTRVQGWKATEIHIVVGTGLARRDVGSLGAPCGLAAAFGARFTNQNEIAISTAYNDYRIHLETGTGRPLDRFGPICSE